MCHMCILYWPDNQIELLSHFTTFIHCHCVMQAIFWLGLGYFVLFSPNQLVVSDLPTMMSFSTISEVAQLVPRYMK